MIRGFLLLALLFGMLFFSGFDSVGAERTRTFLIEGRDSFHAAERTGVSISPDGTLLPSRATDLLTGTVGSQIWSLLVDRAETIYAATGSEGLVYRLGLGGLLDSIQTPEMEVFAGAVGPDGLVYVGGAPNGTIGSIDRTGRMEIFYQTPETIVWDLEVGPDGTVYAATGDQGALYRISATGEGRVLYRVQDSHLLSLAWTPAGTLLVGTDGRGLLLEVDPDRGTATVLYDSPYAEIPEIAVAQDGTIYFAAVPSIDGGIEGFRPPEDPGVEGQGGNGHGSEGGAPRVYVRDPDGTVRVLWESPEQTIQALEIGPAGDLWIGTGEEAAVYRLDSNGEPILVWSPEEREVLDLIRNGERILLATGNPGRIYAIGPASAREPLIEFEPYDAGIRSGWGRALWEVLPGQGDWEIRSRSGETEDPDSTWGAWSAWLDDPEGSPIASPPARYLQCVARYVGTPGSDPARLRRIWIAYSEPNLPPRLGSILFSSDDYGTEGGGSGSPSAFTQDLGGGVRVRFQGPGGGPGEEGQVSPPPWVRRIRSIAWKANDPNDDLLRFEIGIRRVGEQRFRTLDDDLEHNAYAIDTRTLPEGSYEVLVRASDDRVNPPMAALTAERIGGPFRVDHTGPAILGLAARRATPGRLSVEGSVEDASSPIRTLEINWDGGDWRPLIPSDGFLDGRTERFEIEVELSDPDQGRWLAVRAVDAAGNEGVGRLWLED